MEMCLLNANLTVKVVVDIRLVKFPSFARDWIRESSKNLKKKNKPAEKLPNEIHLRFSILVSSVFLICRNLAYIRQMTKRYNRGIIEGRSLTVRETHGKGVFLPFLPFKSHAILTHLPITRPIRLNFGTSLLTSHNFDAESICQFIESEEFSVERKVSKSTFQVLAATTLRAMASKISLIAT